MNIEDILKDEQITNNTMFVISGSDLFKLAISFHERQLAEIKKDKKAEKMLSENEACKKFNLTRQTFHSLRKKHEITYHKLAGRIYYFEHELMNDMKHYNPKKYLS